MRAPLRPIWSQANRAEDTCHHHDREQRPRTEDAHGALRIVYGIVLLQERADPFPEIAVWSGDTVVKDEDGFLYFVGRADDMIKCSGYRISPTDIEEVVYSTNLVSECAALGISHNILGQAIVVAAYAETHCDETSREIIRACKKSLPNYMVPSAIEWQGPLPRNPNGKIDRKHLTNELKNVLQEID